MKCYYLQVFAGDIPVSISAVKNEKFFFRTVSQAIYNQLIGVHYMTRLHDAGIILESNNIPESFLGTIIPFVYQNRKLEMRVYPQVLAM